MNFYIAITGDRFSYHFYSSKVLFSILSIQLYNITCTAVYNTSAYGIKLQWRGALALKLLRSRPSPLTVFSERKIDQNCQASCCTCIPRPLMRIKGGKYMYHYYRDPSIIYPSLFGLGEGEERISLPL